MKRHLSDLDRPDRLARRGAIGLVVAHAVLVAVLLVVTRWILPATVATSVLWSWGVLLPLAMAHFYLWLFWGALYRRRWPWLGIGIAMLLLQITTGTYRNFVSTPTAWFDPAIQLYTIPVALVVLALARTYRLDVDRNAEPPPYQITLGDAFRLMLFLSLIFAGTRLLGDVRVDRAFSLAFGYFFLLPVVPHVAAWTALLQRPSLATIGLSLTACMTLALVAGHGLLADEPEQGYTWFVFTAVYWVTTFASFLYLQRLGFALVKHPFPLPSEVA